MLVPLLLLPLAGAPTGPTVVHFDPAQPPAGAPELEEGSTIVPRRKSYRKAHWWSIKARRVDLSSGERYASNDWLTNFLSMPRSHVLERIGSQQLTLAGEVAAEAAKNAKETGPQEVLPGQDKIKKFFGVD